MPHCYDYDDYVDDGDDDGDGNSDDDHDASRSMATYSSFTIWA